MSTIRRVRFHADVVAVSYALHLELRKVRDAAQVSAQRLLELKQGEKEGLRQATDAATAALRGAVDQAEAGSRAKSTFLSTVSHELRTPLHTLLGYTRMLRDRTTEDETRQPLEVIEKSGRQLLRLIDELLDYTRGDLTTASLQVEPISLRGLAAHLAEAGQLLAAERGNRLRVAVSDGVPDVVEADERRLTQVLQNLVGNACKFTDDGEVWLTIERDAAAQLAPQDDGGTVHSLRFTVADTGIGIASAT